MPELPSGAGLEALLQQSDWLRRFAYALTRDEHAADDLGQEAWLAALRHPPREALDPARLRAWLSVIARRLRWREHRLAQARQLREQASARAELVEPEENYEERLLLQKRVAEALFSLPEPYRSAVAMRYVDELSPSAIAARQGISEEAARQRVSRGLAMLRARLDKDYPGGRDAWCALCVGLLERLPSPIAAAGVLTGAVIMGIKIKRAVALLALALGPLVWWRASSRVPSGPRGAALSDSAQIAGLVAEGADLPGNTSDLQVRREAQLAPAANAESAARTFDRERDLFGIVLDPDGKLLPEAEVTALRKETGGYSWLDLDLTYSNERVASDRTDARGEFSIRLPQGTPFDLEVSHPPYATTWLGYRHAGERIEVRMQRGASLVGRVVRKSDGSPVPGTIVRASPRSEGSVSTRPRVRLVEAVTDEQGRFAFENLPPISIQLWLVPPLGVASEEVPPINLESGQLVEREIALDTGVTIRGRVTDAATGAPIPGAEVGESWVFHRVVQTDANGEYALPGFSKGQRYVAARAPGFGKQEARGYDFENKQFIEQLDFALTRVRSARGRVVDMNGGAVEGVYVAGVGSEWIKGDMQAAEWRSTRSAADGSFEITGLRRDIRLSLLLAKPGYGTSVYEIPQHRSTAELRSRTVADVIELGEVVLPAGALVVGDLVDEQGNSVPDWPIRIEGWNADRTRHFSKLTQRDESVPELVDGPQQYLKYADGRMVPWQGQRIPTHNEDLDYLVGEHTGRTDDLGRFSFADLALGEYKIQAKEPGKSEGDWPSVSFTLEAGRAHERLRLVCPTGLAIAGRVLGPEGKPVAGAWVNARPESPVEGSSDARAYVRADAEGRFRLEGLRRGSYSLRIESDEPAAQGTDRRDLATESRRGVPAGVADLEVRLRRAGYILGRVVNAAGAEREHVAIRVLNGKGEEVTNTVSDARGRFRLRVAQGETYDILAGRNGSPWADAAGIPAGAAGFGLGEGARLDGVAPHVDGTGPEVELRLP